MPARPPAEEFGFWEEQMAARQPRAERGVCKGSARRGGPGVLPLQGTRYRKLELGCRSAHLPCTVMGHGWSTPLQQGGMLLKVAVLDPLQTAEHCRQGAGYPSLRDT